MSNVNSVLKLSEDDLNVLLKNGRRIKRILLILQMKEVKGIGVLEKRDYMRNIYMIKIL